MSHSQMQNIGNKQKKKDLVLDEVGTAQPDIARKIFGRKVRKNENN